MRVLGIDPGLSLTGYGCVELRPNVQEPALVEAPQDWDPNLVHEGILPFAKKATPLITPIARNDLTTLALPTSFSHAEVCVESRLANAVNQPEALLDLRHSLELVSYSS